jgi:hypothetical protein
MSAREASTTLKGARAGAGGMSRVHAAVISKSAFSEMRDDRRIGLEAYFQVSGFRYQVSEGFRY